MTDSASLLVRAYSTIREHGVPIGVGKLVHEIPDIIAILIILISSLLLVRQVLVAYIQMQPRKNVDTGKKIKRQPRILKPLLICVPIVQRNIAPIKQAVFAALFYKRLSVVLYHRDRVSIVVDQPSIRVYGLGGRTETFQPKPLINRHSVS